MVKVYLTIDPNTGYAFYNDQWIFKGSYSSTQAAVNALGDIFKFCKVVNEP